MKNRNYSPYSHLRFHQFVLVFVLASHILQNYIDCTLGYIVENCLTNRYNLHRFDIVDVRSSALKEDVIKRVIGLPGEEISYKNDRLYINGQFVEEPFLKLPFMKKEQIQYDLTQYTKDFRIKLRHDEYFVLGDNRPMSYDSRYFGPVHIEDIRAKNGYIIYPIQHIKRND